MLKLRFIFGINAGNVGIVVIVGIAGNSGMLKHGMAWHAKTIKYPSPSLLET